jgi:tetratricopeptide (TPR) repeat protein
MSRKLRKIQQSVAVFFCLVLWATAAFSQETPWERYIAEGTKAYQQGRFTEAEKYLLAALKEAEGFGREDSRLATSLNNLAALYQTQGKYAEAEPRYKRSLAIREKLLGAEHPDVAASLNNLAELYRTQGKYAEAEPLYKRSLAIKEKVLGAEHPSVATTLENYADLLRKTSRQTEATQMEARAKEIRAKRR